MREIESVEEERNNSIIPGRRGEGKSGKSAVEAAVEGQLG